MCYAGTMQLECLADRRFKRRTGAKTAHFCSMKITENVRKYAAEQDIGEAEVLDKGMEKKTRELTEKGSELCAKE